MCDRVRDVGIAQRLGGLSSQSPSDTRSPTVDWWTWDPKKSDALPMAARIQPLLCATISSSAILARVRPLVPTARLGQVLRDRTIHRTIGVEVVPEDELRPGGGRSLNDGPHHRGMELGPPRVWRIGTMVDDGRSIAPAWPQPQPPRLRAGPSRFPAARRGPCDSPHALATLALPASGLRRALEGRPSITLSPVCSFIAPRQVHRREPRVSGSSRGPAGTEPGQDERPDPLEGSFKAWVGRARCGLRSGPPAVARWVASRLERFQESSAHPMETSGPGDTVRVG